LSIGGVYSVSVKLNLSFGSKVLEFEKKKSAKTTTKRPKN